MNKILFKSRAMYKIYLVFASYWTYQSYRDLEIFIHRKIVQYIKIQIDNDCFSSMKMTKEKSQLQNFLYRMTTIFFSNNHNNKSAQ